MPTIFNVIKAKVGLEIYTPDNQLTPIMRHKMYHFLAPAGYSRIIPFLDRPLPSIKTSIRVAKLTIEKVMSADGIPFMVKLTILYKFDPSNSPRNVIAQFITAPDQVLEDIVTDYTSQGLRRLFGRFQAETLYQGFTMDEIERTLRCHLNAQMRILGLQLPPSGSVLIHATVPPEHFERTMLEATKHQVTLEILSRFKDTDLIPQSLQAELVAGLENLGGNVIVSPNMETAVLGGLLSGHNGKK